MMESKKTKRKKFLRLAQHRTRQAIHYIELLGNLSDKRYYDYDDEHINTIVEALKDNINKMEKAFDEGQGKLWKFKL
tara:strand:- start:1248 stop:1478 length:231 start_codon:yes stop_codon:yes gene_type:complete